MTTWPIQSQNATTCSLFLCKSNGSHIILYKWPLKSEEKWTYVYVVKWWNLVTLRFIFFIYFTISRQHVACYMYINRCSACCIIMNVKNCVILICGYFDMLKNFINPAKMIWGKIYLHLYINSSYKNNKIPVLYSAFSP